MRCSTLFLLILFLPVSILSQNNKTADSLLQAYKTQKEDSLKVKTIAALYNHFLYQDNKKAKKFATEELKLSKLINYQEGIGSSYYHLGVYYNNIDKIDSAKLYYTKSLKIYEALKNEASIANVNHGFAILEYAQGNYNDALNLLDKNLIIYNKPPVDSSSLATSHVFKSGIYMRQSKFKMALNESLSALRIYEHLNEDIRKADALGALASVEFSLENFSESINYNLEALKIYEAYKDYSYAAQALNDIGNAHYYLENYNQALEYLEKSLELSKKNNASDLQATALGNIGKVYTKLNLPEKAISKLNESLEMTKKTGSTYKIIENLNDLGIAHNKLNKPKKAMLLFNEAIALGNTIDSKQTLRISYFNKSASFTALNKHKLAFDSYKQFTALSDSIFNTNKTKQIEELRTIYETEKKEQQILIQQNEIDILKQKGEINTLYKILLGVGFLISLIGFYAVRQKLKSSKIEKEKLDLELEFKKKELTTHALHLAKKNEVLEDLKQKAKAFKSSESSHKGYNQLIRTINFDLKDDNNWENFKSYFEQVHKDFNRNAKQRFPDITPNELRLMALLKMNLSTKEIANILNISPEGVKKARYRLRKKTGISTQDSLQDLVLNL